MITFGTCLLDIVFALWWLFLRIFVVWLLVLGLLISRVCLVLGSGGFGFFGLFWVVLFVG